MGRRPKYKREFCDMLIEHMREGNSYQSFFAMLNRDHGIRERKTLTVWEQNYPEYKTAKETALALSEAWWERLGQAAALGKIKNFNAASWIFVMKNRFHWRDQKDIKQENTGAPQTKLILENYLSITKPKDDTGS